MTDASLANPSAGVIRKEATRVSKRKLATQLQRQLRKRMLAAPLGKRVSREQYLARMLVDLATNFQAQTLDGSVVKIDDIKEWTEIVKFIHSHLDGPVGQEALASGVAVFKVYAGIDMEKV